MSKPGNCVSVYELKLKTRFHCGPAAISRTSRFSGPRVWMNSKHRRYITTRTQSVVSNPMAFKPCLIFNRDDSFERKGSKIDLKFMLTQSDIAALFEGDNLAGEVRGFNFEHHMTLTTKASRTC